MSTYSGCIIEESIKDKGILSEFRILETVVDDGVSYIVETDESKIETVVPLLQKAMTEAQEWYTDLKNEDHHYIIFNDKVFKVDRNCPEQYEEAKDYGLKRNIPEEYLPSASWAK